MSDTLTQPEMQRLYQRGCPAVRYSKLHNLHCDYCFKDSGVSKAGAMLGACHDLAVELGYSRVSYGSGNKFHWASAEGWGCCDELGHPSDLHALVALWHKMKDEQEKQTPSEQEKVLHFPNTEFVDSSDLRSGYSRPVDAPPVPESVTTSGVIDTEQESVAILVAAQAKRLAQLQSDVAKLAECLLLSLPHGGSRYSVTSDIITRNRKES